MLRCLQAAVTDHAELITGRKAEARMSNSAAQVQAEAFDVNLRALLIQGHDKQAAELAQEVPDIQCLCDAESAQDPCIRSSPRMR